MTPQAIMDNIQGYLYKLATDENKGKIAAVLKVFLFVLSLIYGLGVRILIFSQGLRARRVNCRVISVGNITLGGTGKTALVEYIARYLKQQGHKPAILSRGYKRKVALPQAPVGGWENMGDEPYMLQMALKDVPVIVDKDRLQASRRAIRDYGADTVILDDGLQQWRLKKDLEIVTIDATNPFGNRHLLPRGLLRQGLSSLKCADIFVLTKTNLNTDTGRSKDTLNRLNPSGIIVESAHQPLGFYNIRRPEELFKVDFLKGKKVVLFSGIGDPASFESLVASLGIKAGLSFRFRDHHNYGSQDLERIARGAQEQGIEVAITTQKDASRISPSLNIGQRLSLFVLRIELKITKNEEGFHNRLLGLYGL